MSDMKVIVVGKGGREHALVRALKESPSVPQVYAWPGSHAIFELAQPTTDVTCIPELLNYIKSEKIHLCVAGEESYLMEGLSDACEATGIPCWGPKRAGAMLEGSKEFAKEFMVRHNIPTGGYASVSNIDDARDAITSYPCVLKYDGLAAGKGVAVCPDQTSAESFLKEVFEDARFGDGNLLIEEYLEGPEVSIFAMVADASYQILCPARDYKRLEDGDGGPNTGGMGAVASPKLLDADLLAQIEETIVRPTVDGLQKDENPYRGFLYFGLMLTTAGPKVIEYNCRFGDPECQAVMPLIEGDLAGYLLKAASGVLDPSYFTFQDLWSVCVILASAGYPASSRSGDVIRGLDAVKEARVYHSGTKRGDSGSFETNGGRVLAVVAQGTDRESAVERACADAANVDFDGALRRSDIGRLHFN
jgi:phosphoribosylamine---glycine ligase